MNSRKKFKLLFEEVEDDDDRPRVSLSYVYRKMTGKELEDTRSKRAIATMFHDIPEDKRPISVEDLDTVTRDRIRYLPCWVKKPKEVSSSEDSDSDADESDPEEATPRGEEDPEEILEKDPLGVACDTEPKKEFRFRSPIVHLTYKGHLPKKRLLRKINESHKITVVLYSICHENGENDEKTPYEHTHALFWFSGVRDSKSPMCFDYETRDGDVIHPHIKIPHLSLKPQYCGFFYVALVYHRKEDSDAFTNIPDFEWEHITREPNPKEIESGKYKKTQKVVIPSLALVSASNGNMREIGLMPVEQARREMAGIYARIISPKGKPAEASIDKIYDACVKLAVEGIKPAINEPLMVMRSWQEYWKMKIDGRNKQQSRIVNYAYDQKGKFGKSEFIRMLRHLDYKLVNLTVSAKSTQDNLSNLMCREVKKQHLLTRVMSKSGKMEIEMIDIEALFLDVPRDCKDLPDGFYGFIESVCNGQVNSYKYAGFAYEFATRPAIFVLSNHRPDISKFSVDRWAVQVVGPSIDEFEIEILGTSAMLERDRITDTIELSRSNPETTQEVRDSMARISRGSGRDVRLPGTGGDWKSLFRCIGDLDDRERLWEQHKIRRITVEEEPTEDGSVEYVYEAREVKMTERQIRAYEAYKKYHENNDEDIGAPTPQEILDIHAKMLAKQGIRK